MTLKVSSCFNLGLVKDNVSNSVQSFQLSKTYIKRLLKIGTLNIIYQRINIPESEFVTKNYESVDYMLFKTNSNNLFIRNYHTFVRGVIEALEKDYLKEVFIYILDKNTRQVLETYIFKLKYNKSSTATSKEPKQVMDATVAFLKAFANIPGKKWSQDAVELATEIYYNDDTPPEYEPPHFEPEPHPLSTIRDTNELNRLAIVHTGFHKVSAHGKGANFLQTSVSTPALSVWEEEREQATSMKQKDEDNVENATKKRQISETGSAFINIPDESNLDNISIVSSEEVVDCICKWHLPKEFKTTQCTKCLIIVHLVCHGYITFNAVDHDSFICYYCNDSTKACAAKLSNVMKLRIVLYGIHVNKELPEQLGLATKAEKKFILHQLEKFGVYNSQGQSQFEIDMDMLKRALVIAFSVEVEDSQTLE